eukprot:403333271
MTYNDTLLDNRFNLKKILGRGSYATVYSAFDTLGKNNSCALTCQETYLKELKIIQSLTEKDVQGFPKHLASGQLENGMYYIAMTQYGMNLQELIVSRRILLTKKSILQIGIQLVKTIKELHNIGYGHMDIKLDNILINTNDFESCLSSQICIIDFGVAKLLDQQALTNLVEGQNTQDQIFEGNINFSSLSQMSCKKPSRIDDLVSIFFMLIYLTKGKLPWVDSNQAKNQDKSQTFQIVRQAKSKYHQYWLDLYVKNAMSDTKQVKKLSIFEELICELETLENYEHINYEKIIHRLANEITNDHAKNIDWVMDWSIYNQNWKQSLSANKQIFTNFLSIIEPQQNMDGAYQILESKIHKYENKYSQKTLTTKSSCNHASGVLGCKKTGKLKQLEYNGQNYQFYGRWQDPSKLRIKSKQIQEITSILNNITYHNNNLKLFGLQSKQQS